MKKIIITLISLLFLSNINLYAQKNDPILNKLGNASGDNTFLKNFKFDLEPGERVSYSIVLSKKTWYGWYIFMQKNQLEIMLIKDNRNALILDKSSNNINKDVIKFSTKCNKTGVYDLNIKNISNEKVSSAVLLTFEGKFEPKDIEKIKPVIEKNEVNEIQKEFYTDGEESYYFVVDKMPEFIDNIKDFNEFIKKELRYPQEAKDKKINGNVYIQFTVGKDGYIKDAKIARGIHPALDQEALRVVYSSPKWKPGIKDDEPVNVILSFPVIFKLP